MKPFAFAENLVLYAEEQDEYLSLPAHVDKDGVVTTCWALDSKDLEIIKRSEVIYLQILTFKNPLQPVRLMVEKPELKE